jgi:hypothetical protein
MLERIASLLRIRTPSSATAGFLEASGTTVPTDGTAGYATGCTFKKIDGAAGTSFYVNEGSATSCAFAAVAGLTAAQEALLGATPGTVTASKAVIVDANLHQDVVHTASLNIGATGATTALVLAGMTPGAGIVGTATAAGGNVTKIGPMFKTEIFIDLTGLNSGTTAGDIIGKTLTANCHIGQVTAAKNGTIVYGQITCIETPAGGDPDVDFYGTVTEATGTQDTAISTLTGEVLLLNNGDWTGAPATPIAMTALPGVGYLYMVDGGGTAATYSAGQFLVELWGV